MERVTFRIPKEQLTEVENLVDAGEYANRSEFFRKASLDKLREEREQPRTPWGKR